MVPRCSAALNGLTYPNTANFSSTGQSKTAFTWRCRPLRACRRFVWVIFGRTAQARPGSWPRTAGARTSWRWTPRRPPPSTAAARMAWYVSPAWHRQTSHPQETLLAHVFLFDLRWLQCLRCCPIAEPLLVVCFARCGTSICGNPVTGRGVCCTADLAAAARCGYVSPACRCPLIHAPASNNVAPLRASTLYTQLIQYIYDNGRHLEATVGLLEMCFVSSTAHMAPLVESRLYWPTSTCYC